MGHMANSPHHNANHGKSNFTADLAKKNYFKSIKHTRMRQVEWLSNNFDARMEYFTNMTKNQATLALCSWGKYDFEELNGQEIEDFEWSDLTQPRQEDE